MVRGGLLRSSAFTSELGGFAAKALLLTKYLGGSNNLFESTSKSNLDLEFEE